MSIDIYHRRPSNMNRLKILIIGCGGREHAMAKALKRSRYEPEIYCYGNYRNPGILSMVGAYGVGQLERPGDIIKFAEQFRIDFAIIGPENPLVEGLVDTLEKSGIRCIGPRKILASLEGSKSYTRHLLEKYGLRKYNPVWREFSPKKVSTKESESHSCYSPVQTGLGFEELKKNKFSQIEKNVRDFMMFLGDDGLGGECVIKSDGLKGGKGVKVQGDHFKTIDDGIEWCENLYTAKEAFVIEEKLLGQEFSLISFCDGKNIRHSPPVRDYKRVFNSDKGPNCGGMGSITDLDFLEERDIEKAQRINKSVMKALRYDKGVEYVGFLYGSFIKIDDTSEIKVIEYNVRLGDPEAINILELMETDFVDVCMAMLNGSLDELDIKFSNEPSKCVYFVPKGYPVKPQRNVDIDMSFLDEVCGGELDIHFVIAGMKQDVVESDVAFGMSPDVDVEVAYFHNYNGIAIKNVKTTSKQEENGDVIIDMSSLSVSVSEEEHASTSRPTSRTTSRPTSTPKNSDINTKSNVVLKTTGSRAFAIIAVGKDEIRLLDDWLESLDESDRLKDTLYFRTDIGYFESSEKGKEEMYSVNEYDANSQISYKDAGVDIDEGNLAVSNIQEYVRSTYTPLVVDNPGGFGGMMKISNSSGPILVASTDSVGSKSEFVKAFSKKSVFEIYESLGHDIVNHCVNDVLVQSVHTQPLYFLDYFATNRLDRKVFEPFVKGASAACKNAGCVLIGGETAEIPAIYKEGAVDLVGSITGVIESAHSILKPKKTIRPGNMVLALPSVSPHTNGYSLLKKLVERAIKIGDKSYLEHVEDWCKPHKSYMQDVRDLNKYLNTHNMYHTTSKITIQGLCHITGGGLVDNPIRILPEDCKIEWFEDTFEKYVSDHVPWMKWIASRTSPEEFRRVFNCGIGMLVVLDFENRENQIIKNEKGVAIGDISKENFDMKKLPTNLKNAFFIGEIVNK